MKRLLFLSMSLIWLCTGFAQNVININGIPSDNFPEIVPNGNFNGDFGMSRRFREMTVNPQVQSDQKIRLQDVIQLDLFQNKQFKAKVDRLDTDVNGTFSIRARLEGFDYAWCFISTSEGKSLININIPEKEEVYVTRYNPKNGKYILMDMDKMKSGVLEGSPSLLPPEEQDQNDPVNDSGSAAGTLPDTGDVTVNDVNTPDIVSVMIVYTPAAASWATTNEGGINNTISQIMQKSNLALGNSNTLLQFELVYSGQVDYTEMNTSEDLYRLTGTTDGYMDNVHALRNTYGADVVILLENISFTGGIGWLLDSTSGDPSYAFSITRVYQASWTYTTVHEVGHNMGCHHSKLQNYQPGPGIFSYSAGWRWIGTNGGKYCSVMTYEAGSYFPDGVTHTRVPYFSNPSINYQGVPTGNTVDGDNARTLRETKGVVAAYRTAPCTPPTQQAAFFTSSGVTASSMTAGWTRGNGSNVLVIARQGSAVTSNPVNATIYTANAQFGAGTQIGTGNYVVYNGTGNSVTVTGLNSGTAYYFAVYEYNSPSYCYLTPGLTGNDNTTVSVPPAPVATSATNITQTGFQANWSASSGATGYFLDVATSNTFDAGIVLNNLDAGNVTTYPVTGLTEGTTYYYRVRAGNASGTSGNSNIITVATLTPPPPVNPVAIAATNLAINGFTANWNVSSGASGYYLDISTTNRFTGFITGYNNKDVGHVTSFQVTGLNKNTSYYYRVRAYNNAGTSASSNIITAKTLSALPAPLALPATGVTTISFFANWNSVTGATGYYLDVASSSSFKSYLSGFKNKNVGNVNTFQVTGLTPGKTYYYRVRAYYSGGTSANSTIISVIIPASDLSEDVSLSNLAVNPTGLFNSYPNPFNESINLSYSVTVSGRITLEIFDITGRKILTLLNAVQEKGLYNFNWNPKSTNNPPLIPGVYIANFRSEEVNRSLKLVYQGEN